MNQSFQVSCLNNPPPLRTHTHIHMSSPEATTAFRLSSLELTAAVNYCPAVAALCWMFCRDAAVLMSSCIFLYFLINIFFFFSSCYCSCLHLTAFSHLTHVKSYSSQYKHADIKLTLVHFATELCFRQSKQMKNIHISGWFRACEVNLKYIFCCSLFHQKRMIVIVICG